MLILLGIIAGLIVIGLTALNPVGASVGFVLSGVAIAVVVLAYIWLDRWEPEPPRLLIFAFLWGASVAVILSVIIGLFVDSLIVQSGSEDVSWVSIAIGAPVIEEAAKGAFLLLMMTGRRRNELNSLTDCLVYAGLVGAGFAWLEDILYIAGGETLGDSLLTAGVRLIMGPFAHSLFTTMFALGVWFALQNRNPAVKAFYILLGYLGGGDHARALERVVGDRAGDVSRGVCLLDGAGLRVRDRAGGSKSQEGATDRRCEAAGHGGRSASSRPSEATWLNSIKNRKLAIAAASRTGGKPAGKAVKVFAAQVVELAFVRDRIDRGFGDDRVYAMQTDEANRVHAARMETPALQGLVGFQAPPAK